MKSATFLQLPPQHYFSRERFQNITTYLWPECCKEKRDTHSQISTVMNMSKKTSAPGKIVITGIQGLYGFQTPNGDIIHPRREGVVGSRPVGTFILVVNTSPIPKSIPTITAPQIHWTHVNQPINGCSRNDFFYILTHDWNRNGKVAQSDSNLGKIHKSSCSKWKLLKIITLLVGQ